MANDDTLDQTRTRDDAGPRDAPVLALVILWSEDEPHRVGEVALIEHPCVLGRGDGAPGEPRACFLQQRPGRNTPRPALAERRLSRAQLRVRPVGDALHLRNVGRCPLVVGQRQLDQATVEPGAVIRLRTLTLGVVHRARTLPRAPSLHDPSLAWGDPDAIGQVGESPALWSLRERIAFVAGRAGHVLVQGPSGAGKELVARGVHRLSHRAEGPWVARSAATLPDDLVEAELFGHIADYPTAGLAPSPGLVGAAHGGTLFLDELGDVPPKVHARLLRLMDGGEYHHLGNSAVQHADVRVVAATHRPADTLRPDLLARFPHVLQVPPLTERQADVPLLITHLLRRAAQVDALVRERFFDDQDQPRVAAELVAALCVHDWTHHVRELDGLLWQAIAEATGDQLTLTAPVSQAVAPVPGAVDPTALDARVVQQALSDNDGVIEATWRALGLKNRFQLIRLLKKHQLGRYAD